MAEQNRFFLWIYRLLGIVGLLTALGIGWVVLIEIFPGLAGPESGAIAVRDPAAPDKPPLKLRIGRIQHIAGTGHRVLPVMTRSDDTGSMSLGRLRYGGSGVLNLLFIVKDEAQARWLFAENTARIVEWHVLCPCEEQHDDSPAVRLYLEVVKQDSNGNGRLDEDDRRIPALVRVDGTGYTELGGAVERIVDSGLADDGKTFDLLIEDKGRLLDREYDLPAFTLRQTRELATLER